MYIIIRQEMRQGYPGLSTSKAPRTVAITLLLAAPEETLEEMEKLPPLYTPRNEVLVADKTAVVVGDLLELSECLGMQTKALGVLKSILNGTSVGYLPVVLKYLSEIKIPVLKPRTEENAAQRLQEAVLEILHNKHIGSPTSCKCAFSLKKVLH